MVDKLGSKRRPLRIFLTCCKGDSSSLLEPVFKEIISGNRDAKGPMKMDIGSGKSIYVNVSAHGFNWTDPSRRITARQLRGPAIVVSPYAGSHNIVPIPVPKSKKPLSNALISRYEQGRVLRTNSGHLSKLFGHAIEINARRNPLPLKYLKPRVYDGVRKLLVSAAKSELAIDEKKRRKPKPKKSLRNASKHRH